MKLIMIVPGLMLLGSLGVRSVLKGITWHPDLSVRKNKHLASFDLYGLAALQLPKTFRLRGLHDVAGYARNLDAMEQLDRHENEREAVFSLEQGDLTDWGGYARKPVMLNIVLLRSAATDTDAYHRFSIDRYYSPTRSTIPLRDPRWEEFTEGAYQWRILEMDDHFGADHAPRWAITLLVAEKNVRFDLFAWRKIYKREQAMQLLRDAAASMDVRPAMAEHFARSGSLQERMDQRREARIAAFFRSLAPLGIRAGTDGQIVHSPNCAVLVREDRKSVNVLRYLAKVPTDASVQRDNFGRPVLPLSLQPGQYPGPIHNGLPSIYIGMLYWDPATDRWHRSALLSPTANEKHPLLPFEEEISTRLDKDAVHLVQTNQYFKPPALDDAAYVDEFLARCAVYEKDLLAGKIVAGVVLTPDLVGSRD